MLTPRPLAIKGHLSEGEQTQGELQLGEAFLGLAAGETSFSTGSGALLKQ